jgi:RNA polymerase sigma-70 factor (ECF subfamily)
MDRQEEMASLILQHRKVLFAYILAIVRQHHTAEDVFQEVSLVLIRRRDELGPIRNFWHLAREIARRQALGAIRKPKQEEHVLSNEALDSIDRGFDRIFDESELRRKALTACVEQLPTFWQKITRMRYWSNLPVNKIAEMEKRSANTISVTMNKIRLRLADCVKDRMQVEAQ